MKRILLFGTFDGLHFGHVNLFLQAHEIGEEIHVIVARDDTVKETKGRPPTHSELERLEALSKHPLITHARLGNLDDKYTVIKEIKPQIIGLGYDQKHFIDGLDDFLKQELPHAEIVRFKPHREDSFKSSLINDGYGRLA